MNQEDRTEVKEEVKGVLLEVLTPLSEQLAALEGKADKALALASRPAVAGGPAVLRLDAAGRVFELGDNKAHAPAYVRPENLGDKPYSLGKIVGAIATKDERAIPLELHVSDMLKELGYPTSDGVGRSYHVPLSSDEEYLPSINQKADTLRMLLKDALYLPPGSMQTLEAQALLKQLGVTRPVLKAQDPFDDSLGGTLIPYPVRGELIEFLRAATVVGQAGAQQVAIPPGGIDYPKESGRTTFSRRTMGSQTAISASTTATGSVKLLPKELAGLVKIPNSLIRFSNPSVEAVVRRALTLDAALASDLDYLQGAGGSQSPQGMINYTQSANDAPAVDKLTLHNAKTTAANGDTFEAEDPGLMISLVEQAPDPEGPTAFIMNPRLFWILANRRADAVTAGDGKGPFMFPFSRGLAEAVVNKTLLGIKVVTSPQVVLTRRKGSGTTLTYVLCGNFRRVVIGRVGAIELAASQERGFELNETWIRAILWDDLAIQHLESLVFTDTLLQS